MKVVQEKESIMGVSCRQKNPSLVITVWHRSARQWSSERIFLSTPQTTDRLLYSYVPSISVYRVYLGVVSFVRLFTHFIIVMT